MSNLIVKILGANLEVYGLEDVPADAFGVVYGAENRINHKIYVGQTTRGIRTRFMQHAKADSIFGEALREYGIENFVAVILAVCSSKNELDAQEIAWIARLNCKAPNGYNRTAGGDGVFNPAESTREKLAEASKGNKYSLGRRHTEDEKERIRQSNLGQKRSAETCARIRQSKLGTTATQETRDKMSAKRKGRKFTQEHKDKISAARKAYWARRKAAEGEIKLTREHRAKISKSLIGNQRAKKTRT